jgi:hypothetical protein
VYFRSSVVKTHTLTGNSETSFFHKFPHDTKIKVSLLLWVRKFITVFTKSRQWPYTDPVSSSTHSHIQLSKIQFNTILTSMHRYPTWAFPLMLFLRDLLCISRLLFAPWNKHNEIKGQLQGREGQECGGLLSRNRPWGLDHEDDDEIK